jgi:hypothetical protein
MRAGVKFPPVTPKIPRVILCKDYTREMKVVEMMVRYEK